MLTKSGRQAPGSVHAPPVANRLETQNPEPDLNTGESTRRTADHVMSPAATITAQL